MIAEQLHQLMTHGLLDRRQTGPPLTITAPVPAAAAVDDFVRTWPGLTGVIMFPQVSCLWKRPVVFGGKEVFLEGNTRFLPGSAVIACCP